MSRLSTASEEYGFDPAVVYDHEEQSGTVDKIYPAPQRPMPVARALMRGRFNLDSAPTIVFWRDQFWEYRDTQWNPVPVDQVRRYIYFELEDAKFSSDKTNNDTPVIVDWNPNAARVSNVYDALKAVADGVTDETDAPAWITRRADDAPAGEHVALQNGVLHLPTGTLVDPTPDFFNTWSLAFDYDPAATCPQWEKFITETFAHDPAGGLAMQEWFGYVISGRTDLQKGCMFIGPGGSGKGVTDRILKSLMGEDANVVAASVQSLTNGFGLADWVGKPLATLSDSRDSGAIPDAVVSRLLSIIGEDTVPVEAKHKNNRSEKLPTRIMIMSNELPSFRDSSGALVKRWIVIETAVSHRDNPDLHLEDRLRTELPGIFLWALAGLERLEEQGHFTMPLSTAETIEMLNDNAAPESMFITENYEITEDPADFEWLSEVYPAYELWIERRGNRPVSQTRFKGKVKASGLRGVTVTKRERDGIRKEVIAGISRRSF